MNISDLTIHRRPLQSLKENTTPKKVRDDPSLGVFSNGVIVIRVLLANCLDAPMHKIILRRELCGQRIHSFSQSAAINNNPQTSTMPSSSISMRVPFAPHNRTCLSPLQASNGTPKAGMRKSRPFLNDLKKANTKSTNPAKEVSSENTSTTPNKCRPTEQLSVFRSHRVAHQHVDEEQMMDDFWTIRRANPIFDDDSSDDDEEEVELENLHPERSVLYWDDAQTAPISFR